MKKLLIAFAAVAAIVAVISCGGDGGPKSFSATTRNVQHLQRLSFLSMANSGLAFISFGGGSGSGTTGGTTGTGGFGPGGGYSSMGGFIRNLTGAGLMSRPLGDGTTGGTGGGVGGQYFYYDEWLQLWVDTNWTDTSFTSLFYLDEAKTRPAGHAISTFTDNWETYPQVYTSEYEYTAGRLAGANGTYNCSQTSMLEGSMSYHDTYSDGSHDQGSSNWSVTGSHWQWRWDGADGSWYQDSGDWTSGFVGTYTSSNSEGWSSTWHYNADGSGNAHFEGPDPRLPADLTWTSTGHFHITYSDGTSEDWNWDDLWEGEEGGTTGVGTSGSLTAGGSEGSTSQGGTGEGTTGVSTTTGSGTTGAGTTGSGG